MCGHCVHTHKYTVTEIIIEIMARACCLPPACRALDQFMNAGRAASRRANATVFNEPETRKLNDRKRTYVESPGARYEARQRVVVCGGTCLLTCWSVRDEITRATPGSPVCALHTRAPVLTRDGAGRRPPTLGTSSLC